MAEPVTRTWDLKSPAPVQSVWAALSDTDRFNRAAGLGFQYTDDAPAEGQQGRRGWGHFLLGIRGEWDEPPFQHKAPEWFRIYRRFRGGPVTESVVTCRLKPDGQGGTDIRYTVALTPANALASFIAQAELAFNTGPKLERGFDQILGELLGGSLPPALRPPPLDAQAKARLDAAELSPPAAREALVRTLNEAPLRDQDRMHPLRLARQWGLPPEQVVPLLLDATRQGLLALRWELLCPMCLGATERPERLSAAPPRVHCASCNIYFDGTFPDSVAVVFRPADTLRRFEVGVDCAGSPGRTPHILARQALPAGREGELTLTLAPGAYRLRTWPPRETCALEVYDGAPAGPTAVKLGELRFTPARLSTAPGEVTLRVDHAPGRDVDLILERVQRPEDVLTAGRLLTWPGARPLLPERCLDPALQVEVQRGAVLALPRGDAAAQEAALRGAGATTTVVGDRGALGVFPTVSPALRLAQGQGAGVVCAGPVLRVGTPDGRTVPMGAPVDRALGLLPMAQDRLVLPAEAEEDPEVAEALAALGMRTATPPWTGAAPAGAVLVMTRG